jgi:hypothetical protein
MVFIPESRKELDYHFILWRFDMSKIDTKLLERLEAKQIRPQQAEDSDTASEEEAEDGRKKVENTHASSCCILF